MKETLEISKNERDKYYLLQQVAVISAIPADHFSRAY